MVGGRVVEVSEVKNRPDVLYVDCADFQYRRKRPDTCAIYIEKNRTSELIEIGDSLWWQGRFAMWTPLRNCVPEDGGEDLRCGIDYDIEIPRIGYSGVDHPDRSKD